MLLRLPVYPIIAFELRFPMNVSHLMMKAGCGANVREVMRSPVPRNPRKRRGVCLESFVLASTARGQLSPS